MSDPSTMALSKKLSLVLRHDPESMGLSLSVNGWVDIEVLLQAFAAKQIPFTREVLNEVVSANDKKRFTVSEDGLRIRAAQGHSTAQVKMKMSAVLPPMDLYHGTSRSAWERIEREGLKPMNRHHVHLSADVATAMQVGGRHTRHGKDPLVILHLKARAMAADGHRFYQADNGVWLVDMAPASYVDLLEMPAASIERGAQRFGLK